MKGWYLASAAIALCVAGSLAQSQSGVSTPLYKNPKTAVEQRVADLLRRMTAEEKAAMLGGSGWMETQPNQRLGIPALKMADGPLGVRNWRASSAETNGPGGALPQVHSTAFPASVAMAASWDPELVRREGQEIAR